MRGLISLAVIFFLFLPAGVSAKDDPLHKEFPLNTKKILYFNCSGTINYKRGANPIEKGEWAAAVSIGDGRLLMRSFQTDYGYFLPCEERAAYGRWGCKLGGQRHGYIAAQDTFSSKKDKEAGRKPIGFKNQWVMISRYTGAITFRASYAIRKGFQWGDGTCTIGKQLF